MKHRAGVGLVNEIGLVEGIVAIGPVLVSTEIERAVGGIYRAQQ
jgi:hypothetical protein